MLVAERLNTLGGWRKLCARVLTTLPSGGWMRPPLVCLYVVVLCLGIVFLFFLFHSIVRSIDVDSHCGDHCENSASDDTDQPPTHSTHTHNTPDTDLILYVSPLPPLLLD